MANILEISLEIPTQPSLEELNQAKAFLEEVVEDFPFKDASSRANALAAMILPFVRQMIDGPTPLHLIDASTPGSGKSLLARVLAYPILGTVPPTMTEGETDQEWRKRLSASLLKGMPVLLLDNLSKTLDSASLAAVLTSIIWEDRYLGKTEILRIVIRTTFLATGNNVMLSNELSRRTIWIRLEPSIERPWQRKGFRHPDLEKWSKENRSAMVRAILIVVQYWIAIGKLDGDKILGGFESWARVIGGILKVAGIPGFLDNAEELYGKADEEASIWREFTLKWWESYQENEVTVSQLVEITSGTEFVTALLNGKAGHGLSTALGKELLKNTGRVFGGYQIRHSRVLRTGSRAYCLKPLVTNPEGSSAYQGGE